jgi:biopolymer transport protein TolR
MCEINVTPVGDVMLGLLIVCVGWAPGVSAGGPVVDVMLVLLIVFRGSAPLLTSGVPVDLPEAQATPLAIEKEPITITIDPDGRVFLQENEIDVDNIVESLGEVATNGFDERIYVRGDRASSYGAIMRVMGIINGAGYRHIGPVALKEPDG